MRRDLEALLFATDQPLSLDRLASFFPDVDRNAVREALNELRNEYDRDKHAFTIVEFGGGYSVSTRPEHAGLVKRLFRGRRKQRLSRAALEALAIIAYKQPVTRLEIEEIRGVSAAGVVGTLLERDLVQIVGRAESLGHPLLYGTTKSFLDYLGLAHVRELPQLSELEDILAEKEELKQLASARGSELGDDDIDEMVASRSEGDAPDADATEDADVSDASEVYEDIDDLDEAADTVATTPQPSAALEDSERA